MTLQYLVERKEYSTKPSNHLVQTDSFVIMALSSKHLLLLEL